MSAAGPADPDGIVVVGTDFGRTYLDALHRADQSQLHLTGILGLASSRTLACAQHYQVPAWTDIAAVPDATALACVVVGGTLNHKPGTDLARQLLRRGISVLQEHPCTTAEIAELSRLAHQTSCVYAVQCHYHWLPAMRRMVQAAQVLGTTHPPEHLSITTSRVMLTAATQLAATVAGSFALTDLTVDRPSGPLTQVGGTLGQIPIRVAVQNTYHPLRPDTGARTELAAAVTYPSGVLTLLSPQGPLIWTPRLHRPAGYDDTVTISELDDPTLDLPAALDLTGASPPLRRRQLADQWPTAVLHGIITTLGLRQDRAGAAAHTQRILGVARVVDSIQTAIGPPDLTVEPEPDLIGTHRGLTRSLLLNNQTGPAL